VDSIPLIAASILSKKLAEDLDGLVLDVKVGSGAFMRSRGDAERLARTLVDLAVDLGCPAVAWVTSMDAPLGAAVGNANELLEAVEVLRGGGPADVRALTLRLGAEMLVLGHAAPTVPRPSVGSPRPSPTARASALPALVRARGRPGRARQAGPCSGRWRPPSARAPCRAPRHGGHARRRAGGGGARRGPEAQPRRRRPRRGLHRAPAPRRAGGAGRAAGDGAPPAGQDVGEVCRRLAAAFRIADGIEPSPPLLLARQEARRP
jgi:hypothetical protein